MKKMPTVEYKGKIYSLLRRNQEIPDLQSLPEMEALLWLIRNTRAKGYLKQDIRFSTMEIQTR